MAILVSYNLISKICVVENVDDLDMDMVKIKCKHANRKYLCVVLLYYIDNIILVIPVIVCGYLRINF